MNSTLKPRESDPHDVFTISPDIVPSSWADKVVADIQSKKPAPVQTPVARPAADHRVPDIDVANDRPAGPPPSGSRMKGTIIAFLFALCSAFAAAGWQHYGATAKQMISAWVPPFALTSSTEPTGLAAKPDTPDVAAAEPVSAPTTTPDQAPPQPAPAQAADAAAPAAAPSADAPTADAAQVQSMARDLAAMGQEIALLKASVAELKAAQQPAVRDAAKTSDVRTSDLKPSLPISRPKAAAPPPPRPVAAAPRRPVQAYSTQGYSTQGYSGQGYPAQTYPSAQAASPPPMQPYPSRQPAPMAAEMDDGEPVVRPPMPLH